jgi:proline dehydrogenase
VLRQGLILLSESSIARRIATAAPGARAMARRFVAGETLDDGMAAARRLNAAGFKVSVDCLGESVQHREDAVAAAAEYVQLIQRIRADRLDANVSLKLTQMGLDIDPAFLRENLGRVLDVARAADMFVRFDMESSAYTQRTLDFFQSVWHEGYHNCGIVLQSYLRRSESDVCMANALGARVRLCKGAYREPADVAYQEKQEVDASFLRLMRLLLSEGNYPGIATHDEAIVRATRDHAARLGLGPDRFEFQMLYGVRRDLQHQLLAAGYNVRVYVPFGRAWYPYLMRRLAERPANVVFVVRAVLAESPLRFLVRRDSSE